MVPLSGARTKRDDLDLLEQTHLKDQWGIVKILVPFGLPIIIWGLI